ncbi:hypothetical protein MNBD_PLANCTO02-247 [hydrothermal vent metagenome]|uniref:Uncharacterized protein n=1 Tax=hydrothermal vent metagenome TaxID=652676 RepID=A0A3B1DWB0_9ZZZZ
MFRLLIPTLALLSVLGHSMFGCCWHHAHLSEKKVSSKSESYQPKTSAHSHHHAPFHRHAMASSISSEEEDRNQNACYDECCNYTLFLEQGLNKVCDTSIEKDFSPHTIYLVIDVDSLPLVCRKVRRFSNASAIVSCALPSQVSQI